MKLFMAILFITTIACASSRNSSDTKSSPNDGISATAAIADIPEAPKRPSQDCSLETAKDERNRCIAAVYGYNAQALRQAYSDYASTSDETYQIRPWSEEQYRALNLAVKVTKAEGKKVAKFVDAASGLKTVIMDDELDRTILIASAGVEFKASWRDITNMQTFLFSYISGMDNLLLHIVRAVTKTFPDKPIILIGHSLGGRPTQFVGLMLHKPVVCFACLGLLPEHTKAIIAETHESEEQLWTRAQVEVTQIQSEQDYLLGRMPSTYFGIQKGKTLKLMGAGHMMGSILNTLGNK